MSSFKNNGSGSSDTAASSSMLWAAKSASTGCPGEKASAGDGSNLGV